MSFKEKVKNFGKAILSIPIGLVIAIPFIISLPMIPIISIFDLISEFLVKSRQEKESTGQEKESTGQEKEFTASNALKEALEEFQADSLPDYQVLRDNEQSSVSDLTSAEKERIARFGRSKDPDVQELIKTHQDKDEVMKKLLLGCIKLNDNASVQRLKYALRAGKEESKEGSVVSDVVRRITIIPKIFLFLFLRALEAIGLSHVKLPKSETYKKEITAAFSLFKSKASMLLNSRSTMEEEVAKLLRDDIVDIISLMTCPCFLNESTFVDQCEKITVKPEDHDKYEKINNKIAEKIAGIFRLLTNVKLGLLSDNSKEFKDTFNHEVYNLLKCARFADLNVSPNDMEDEEIIPSLESMRVQILRTSFSNFLDNLLQSKAISGLSKAQQADYINICCTKVLKACIGYGSIYGSNCPEPSVPRSYSGHVDSIATHLSNDIIKTLSTSELNKAYLNADIFEYLIRLFSREGIVGELCSPMKPIMWIIRDYMTKDKGQFSETDISVPDGIKIGEIESQPAPSLSETSSSQDKARVNGQQV